MGVTETALLGIACLMTNAQPAEKEAMARGLTIEERAAVEEMKEFCVPEKLKAMLRAGREEVGVITDARVKPDPTLMC